jgi:hypothetical protein
MAPFFLDFFIVSEGTLTPPIGETGADFTEVIDTFNKLDQGIPPLTARWPAAGPSACTTSL